MNYFFPRLCFIDLESIRNSQLKYSISIFINLAKKICYEIIWKIYGINMKAKLKVRTSFLHCYPCLCSCCMPSPWQNGIWICRHLWLSSALIWINLEGYAIYYAFQAYHTVKYFYWRRYVTFSVLWPLTQNGGHVSCDLG